MVNMYTPTYHLSDDIETRKIAATELADMFAGKFIGRGVSRWVFECQQDPTRVLKCEMAKGNEDGLFQNAIEWNIWTSVRSTKWAKWFAPCVAISPNGYYLIQEKVEPIAVETMRTKYPKLPTFFTDTKAKNFGMYKGRLVACDYGININTSLFEHRWKERKVAWWDE